jgi:hypothetical protein
MVQQQDDLPMSILRNFFLIRFKESYNFAVKFNNYCSTH